MSIGALLGVPRARRLFRRAILQSGAAENVHPPERALRVTEAVLEAAGVRDARALRSLPLPALLAAQARGVERLSREMQEPPFQPVIDGVLLGEAPLAAIARGDAARIPLLVGTNRDEWRFYGLTDPRWQALDDARLLRRLRRGLPGADAAGRERAERALETYRAARAPGVPASDLWFAIQTDRWFRAPAMRLAERQAAHQPETWAYLFARGSPAFGGWLGSCHSVELPFVFGTFELAALRPLVGADAGARSLSERMQAAWLAFVWGERPAAPGLPDWPAYAPPRRATLVLDEPSRVEDAPAERERALWDELG
jgi:para-nitrobenzyl esterase